MSVKINTAQHEKASEINYEKNTTVVSNQEIMAKKWRFDTIFKIIAGIFYGMFFGLIPPVFKFNSGIISPNDTPTYEFLALFSIFITSMISIVVIYWSFKGDFKKQNFILNSIAHIINSVILFVILVVTTILYPNSSSLNRYFILAISFGSWSILLSVVIAIALAVNRKKFPLTWSKMLFSIFSLLFAGCSQIFIYLSAKAKLEGNYVNQETMFVILTAISFLLSLIVLGFGIVFVKRYRDVLLSERTEYEINTIQDWESARILSIVVSSITIATYSIILIISNSMTFIFESPLLIELIIDVLLIVPYIVLISCIKSKNAKNKNKSFFSSRTFRPIDNSLLLDVFSWIILIKATLLEGIYIDEPLTMLQPLILVISLGSIFILYAFNIIMSFNIPNLRNTAVSVPTICFAILLMVFAILFGGFLKNSTDINNYVFIFMPLIVLVGLSISLIIKICIVAKIFKSDWGKQKSIVAADKNYVVKEQWEERK